VKLRCHLLSLLRIHRPDCEHCNVRETCGAEMRERLEELNRRTQPNLLKEEFSETLRTVSLPSLAKLRPSRFRGSSINASALLIFPIGVMFFLPVWIKVSKNRRNSYLGLLLCCSERSPQSE
jgi:hypothetical protein